MVFYERSLTEMNDASRTLRSMTHRRTAYELSRSQVSTPIPVIPLFWQLTKQYRTQLESVLDMGAGDCRLATGGSFDRYTGVEIDKERVVTATPPANGKI